MNDPVTDAARAASSASADAGRARRSTRSSRSCAAGCTLATAPLTLAAGIVLIALSPDATTRIGSAVFAASALLLFTVSAIYHRGTLVTADVGVPAPASTTPTSSC